MEMYQWCDRDISEDVRLIKDIIFSVFMIKENGGGNFQYIKENWWQIKDKSFSYQKKKKKEMIFFLK